MDGLSLLQLIPLFINITGVTFVFLKRGSRIKGERILLLIYLFSSIVMSFSYYGLFLGVTDGAIYVFFSMLMISVFFWNTSMLFLCLKLLSIYAAYFKAFLLISAFIFVITFIVAMNISSEVFAENYPDRIEVLGSSYPRFDLNFGYNLFSLFVGLYFILTIVFIVRSRFTEKTKRVKKIVNIFMLSFGFPTFITFAIAVILFPFFLLSDVPPSVISFAASLTTLFLSYFILKDDFPVISPQSVSDNILDIMNNYVLVLDNNKKIVFINKAAEDVFGKSSLQVIGKSLGSMFSYIGRYRGCINKKDGKKIHVAVRKKDFIKAGKKIGEAIIMRNIEEIDLITVSREKEMIDLKRKIKKLKLKTSYNIII